MATESRLPSPGDVVVGKYRVDRLLGQGGMGAVFAAQHLLLNQPVALKLLLGELADNPEATRRFLNEARAAAQIRGEHVVRVLDIGQLPTGAPFMVLEYLEGSDLAQLLQARGPLPVSEVADFALQALDALAQAHAAGIVHRDLKPANLFLARRHDGTSLVKVLDFGISKNLSPLEAQGQHGMTSTRALLGSPEYMSPEQLRNPRGVDTRTDIWSMGVILYELLTGAGPFKAETLAELFVAILESTPAPIRTVRGDVPPAFEAVITRCLARDPSARFANVGELAASLMIFASDQMRAIAAARGVSPASLHSAPSLGEVSARTANTAAPWANTGAGRGAGTSPGGGRRTKVVGAIAGAVLLACVVVVGGALAVTRFVSHGDPGLQAAGTGSGALSVTVPPMVNVAPAVLPPLATHDAAAAPSKAPPAVAPPPAPAPHKYPPAAPPRPAPAPGPAPAPANNCNPNFYFDKDGNKHFKPECF